MTVDQTIKRTKIEYTACNLALLSNISTCISKVISILAFPNPFIDTVHVMNLCLNTKKIAEVSAMQTVKEIQEDELLQYQTFIWEQLVDLSKATDGPKPLN